jgi:hypothetical protein
MRIVPGFLVSSLISSLGMAPSSPDNPCVSQCAYTYSHHLPMSVISPTGPAGRRHVSTDVLKQEDKYKKRINLRVSTSTRSLLDVDD